MLMFPPPPPHALPSVVHCITQGVFCIAIYFIIIIINVDVHEISDLTRRRLPCAKHLDSRPSYHSIFSIPQILRAQVPVLYLTNAICSINLSGSHSFYPKKEKVLKLESNQTASDVYSIATRCLNSYTDRVNLKF